MLKVISQYFNASRKYSIFQLFQFSIKLSPVQPYHPMNTTTHTWNSGTIFRRWPLTVSTTLETAAWLSWASSSTSHRRSTFLLLARNNLTWLVCYTPSPSWKISSKSFSRSPWNLRGISNISETGIGEMTLMALISCSKTWSTRTRFYAIRYSIQSSRFLQKYCQGPIGLLFNTLRWTRSSESLRRSMRVRTHQRLT